MQQTKLFSEAINLPIEKKKELIKLLVDSISMPEQHQKTKKNWNQIGAVRIGKKFDLINLRDLAHE
jgi:hypothetical protein